MNSPRNPESGTTYYVVTKSDTFGPFDYAKAVKEQNRANARSASDGEGSCDALILTAGQVRLLGAESYDLGQDTEVGGRILTVRQTPASVGNPAYDQTFASSPEPVSWIVYRTDTGATVAHYASADRAIRHAIGANVATGCVPARYGVDRHYSGDDDGSVRTSYPF